MTEIRNLLLIGRTNSGKSALANVLIDKENLFKEGKGGGIGTTKIPQKNIFEHNNLTYQLIDTAGLNDSDTKLSAVETIEKLLTIFSDTKEGINQILFLVRGNFTQDQIFFLNSLAEIFFGNDFSKYITVVKTDVEFFESGSECKEDIEAMKNKDKRLERFDLENKLIHIDNPSVNYPNEKKNSLNRGDRKKSRLILLNHLTSKCNDIHQIDVVFNFLDSFKKNNELNSESFEKFIKKIEENKSKINSTISENKNVIKEINKSESDFSSLGFGKASLLTLRTAAIGTGASALSAAVTVAFPPAESLALTFLWGVAVNENKVWIKEKGNKRKENWGKWLQELYDNGKKIEQLFKYLNSFDITGSARTNSISINEKIESFIERNKKELENLSNYSSGEDKESSKFVKEFVELIEEINNSLISLNSAYQNPINYSEKVIKFLDNVELIAKIEQSPKY
ncbi:MAG: GTPase Der [Mycoplasmataceae bacterium]|nr:MAG: GTPase Der [Mycoplasmataceae bacterium]